MPVAIRVIPCLDVSGGRVVKGVNFENLRDAGDPVELAAKYYREGADEITFLDVSATVDERATMFDVVSQTAEQVFIPLTVGGGVRTVADVARPDLLDEIAQQFGSQVLVLSLDIKRADHTASGFVVTSHGGRQTTDLDALAWAREAIQRGVGELLVNSIDADGTKNGFDLQLIEEIRRLSSVPVIASGGAGKPEHFAPAIAAGADAVLAASIFHSGEVSIMQVKESIAAAGYAVR
jgi:cyclase